MELPVGGGAVLVLADALVHGLAAGENFFHFLRGGPLAGQAGGGRLEDGPQLEEVPQFAAHLVQAGKAVVVDLGGFGGDEGAPAPSDL